MVDGKNVLRVWIDEDKDEGVHLRWHVVVGTTVVYKTALVEQAAAAVVGIERALALTGTDQEAAGGALFARDAGGVQAGDHICSLQDALATRDAEIGRLRAEVEAYAEGRRYDADPNRQAQAPIDMLAGLYDSLRVALGREGAPVFTPVEDIVALRTRIADLEAQAKDLAVVSHKQNTRIEVMRQSLRAVSLHEADEYRMRVEAQGTIARMRPVVDAAVAHVDADTTSEINTTIEVLGDVVRTYKT